jgi:Coenzyme PQQ synthesis protein D (PqqD)
VFPGSTAPKAKAGLDISAAENGFIVFQPEVERVHYLNHSAVLVLELCTGQNSVSEIATLVQEAYSLPDPPCQAVEETVASLGQQGLLELS